MRRLWIALIAVVAALVGWWGAMLWRSPSQPQRFEAKSSQQQPADRMVVVESTTSTTPALKVADETPRHDLAPTMQPQLGAPAEKVPLQTGQPTAWPVPPAALAPEQATLAEWTITDVAVDSLGRIGAPAVPALVELLADRDPKLRVKAARSLARIGPEARPAVPALVLALTDQDATVRWFAARALGQIGPDAGNAVPALMRTIEAK